MRFSAIHKLVSYLMVLAATLALLLSPDVSALTALLALGGIAASWFADPPRFASARLNALWTVATVLFLGYLILSVVFLGDSAISAGVSFLLFVLINKLFNRKASKDYQQAYAVSFLLLVAATTLNTGLSFALCFVGYVVFATWALMLFHLRRETEENYLLKHAEGGLSERVQVERILNSRRVVGGKFLAGTSLLSLGVLLTATLIFTFFPRIGFGLLAGHRRGGITMVGFSDEVRLGQHGNLRDNPQVVLRAVLPPGQRPAKLLWRGSALDRYDGGVWSHGPRLAGRRQAVTPVEGLYHMNPALGAGAEQPPAALRRSLLRQEIYLEPLESSLLFAADRPVALEVPRRKIDGRLPFVPLRGPHGELRAGRRVTTNALRYTAYSQARRPSAALLRRSPPLAAGARAERFLQLPQSLPPRVLELARRITARAPTSYDKVIAIERHLQQRYRYTLELSHDRRREPIDEFLFVTRAGHCEYFASAMTLLLRAVGIPARNVNGFAGGTWNAYGNYWAVRQGDAHAWTEVLFASAGWVAFDPTPPASGPRGDVQRDLWSALAQLIDTVRMRWLQHVVEYDLGQQLSLARRLGELFGRSGDARGDGAALRRPLLVLLGAGAALAIAALLWRRRARRAGAGPPRGAAGWRAHPATAIYRRALAALARHGVARPAHVTPAELSAQLRARCFAAAEPLAALTRAYYECRYAAPGALPERLARLRALAQDVQRALRDASPRATR